jgi:hypothetical protein
MCFSQEIACNAVNNVANKKRASGTNVQTFTGSLGGTPPPVISTAGSARAFSVLGDTFVNAGAALQRSCSVQHNACANAANSGAISGGVGQCETQEEDCNKANAVAKRAAADFGKCTDPSIVFGPQSDRANADAFVAADQTHFPHGSALNIKVIADFICQRLGDNTCGADATAIANCQKASTAAQAATQNQAAADAFNSALGVSGGSGAGAAVAQTTAAVVSSSAAAVAATSTVMTITSCV